MVIFNQVEKRTLSQPMKTLKKTSSFNAKNTENRLRSPKSNKWAIVTHIIELKAELLLRAERRLGGFSQTQ